jgi:hypothetical protein
VFKEAGAFLHTLIRGTSSIQLNNKEEGYSLFIELSPFFEIRELCSNMII